MFDSLIEDIPKFPMIIFEVCAILCMSFSAFMHLFWVKDKQTCEKVHKLDLIGIMLLILGSGIGLIYYEFMCMPFYKNLYMIINSLIACCVIYTMVCGGEFVSYYQNQFNRK